MKAIYKNRALAALALSAVACTQEEEFAPSFLNDPDAVRITAQVASGNVTGGFTRSNPLGTTEAEQKAFNSGDAIAVTAGNQDAVTYTFNGTTWTPEEGKYLKWVADEMTFTAWYPAGKNNASANTFTVPTSYADVNAMADADYMVYTGTKNKTSGNGVTLTMNRKMARIVITPEMNDEFAEGYSITGIKVHANTSGYASGTVQAGNIEVTAFEQNDVYYALLAPTTAADATFLTVTVTKTDDSTSQNLTVKGIPATEAGKSYEYTLTVGKDKATIGNVTVADWGTSQEINGGKAEEVNACYLPEGTNFRNAVKTFLTSNASLTQIRFIAEPTWTPQGTQIEESGAYMVANGATLEIRTDAKVFMFNADCSLMFGSILITSIDFNGCINTSNVTNLDFMFQYCGMLTSLDLRGFNTANVTILQGMFQNCTALQDITFGNSFSTNKVTAMDYMFQSCKKLTSLDLTGFSFNNNPTTKEMFYYAGGDPPTENRIPIKVTETGYNFLKGKTDTKIETSNAKYVQPDGVTPWETSTP